MTLSGCYCLWGTEGLWAETVRFGGLTMSKDGLKWLLLLMGNQSPRAETVIFGCLTMSKAGLKWLLLLMGNYQVLWA